MKIKTKLNLGVGLLFILILLLTVVSAYYVFLIKKDTQNILKANYNTLEYSRNMLLSLDAIKANKNTAMADFETNLNLQIKNITEVGEDKITSDLKAKFNALKFNALKNDKSLDVIKNEIRNDIFEIMSLNMKAIKKKSDKATTTAETGNLWIAITGTLCFLIAFNLLVNLPNNIANPVKELTASIKQIADENYSERVHFMNHNEYGDLAKSFNVMAQKLQEYNNSNLSKILFEKKRLETLINNMHDPIIGLDNMGVVLFVNDEALKIMAIKDEDIIGKKIADLSLTNDLVKSLINEPVTNMVQPMKIFADGKESYFEKEKVNITIKSTGEEKYINIGEVIILRNITIFKELDFAKTNFIATVSHELKTPISSIKFSLTLLQNESTGNINNEQQQLIESIGDDMERLLKITGELLELSQVETGNIHLNISKNSPYEIIKLAIDAVKVQAEQKTIMLDMDIENNLPNVKADTEKTAWVLINFLTNAIRYSTENNHVTLKAFREVNHLRFEVIDKGKGIDNKYKTKVFDKYFQVPGSHKSGTGLGLAISKEFIEAQSGAIGVQSQLGLGSTFFFILPFA